MGATVWHMHSRVKRFMESMAIEGLLTFVTDTTAMPYHPWISRTLAIDHLEIAVPRTPSSSFGRPTEGMHNLRTLPEEMIFLPHGKEATQQASLL